MEDAGRPVYSIGAVATMLSIAPATLRSWEDRYGLVVPQRSPGGHRLYSRDQLDHLRFVQARLADGVHASDAHRLLAERLATPEPGAGLPTEPAATAGHPVILVAEQDPYAAELAEFFLRTEGYAVVSAFDAATAAELFATRAPVLAVVELLISGGIGVDVCRSFKRDHAIPVIVVSSLEVRDDAAAAGADAFLSKPLDPLLLVSTVKDLLGSSAFLRTAPAQGDTP